ncbi:MAG: hypothetical protein V1820_06115 [archaeon]
MLFKGIELLSAEEKANELLASLGDKAEKVPESAVSTATKLLVRYSLPQANTETALKYYLIASAIAEELGELGADAVVFSGSAGKLMKRMLAGEPQSSLGGENAPGDIDLGIVIPEGLVGSVQTILDGYSSLVGKEEHIHPRVYAEEYVDELFGLFARYGKGAMLDIETFRCGAHLRSPQSLRGAWKNTPESEMVYPLGWACTPEELAGFDLEYRKGMDVVLKGQGFLESERRKLKFSKEAHLGRLDQARRWAEYLFEPSRHDAAALYAGEAPSTAGRLIQLLIEGPSSCYPGHSGKMPPVTAAPNLYRQSAEI